MSRTAFALAFVLGAAVLCAAPVQPGAPNDAWLFDNDLTPFAGSAANGSLEGSAAYDAATTPFSYAGNYAVNVGGTGGDKVHTSRVNFSTDLGGAYEGAAALTVSMWIKSNSAVADAGFFCLRDPSGSDEWGMRYDSKDWAHNDDPNIIKAAITTTDSQQWDDGKPRYDQADNQYSSATNVQTTAWQHVVLVWQGDANTSDGDDSWFRIYLDGVEDSPIRSMPETSGLVDETTHFFVGDGGKSDWDGYVDEVAVWTDALSADEVAWLSQNSLSELPEPATLGLLAAGALVALGRRRRR